MKKNETDLIKCKSKRILTAKGYKFLSRCIEIAAEQRGLTRYHVEFKPIKEKLQPLIIHLIIDREFNLSQIKEAIKSRINSNTILN